MAKKNSGVPQLSEADMVKLGEMKRAGVTVEAQSETIDLERTPVEKGAWKKLIEDGRRYFVKKSALTIAAKAVKRQLTLDEVDIIVSPVGEVSCDYPDTEEHAREKFVEHATLVISGADEGENEDSNKPLIPGLPKEISDLVARHPDGNPKVMGSHMLIPQYNADGKQVGWETKAFCGSRYFVGREDGKEVESMNNRSHLGRAYFSAVNALRKRGIDKPKVYTYTRDGAAKTIEVRQSAYQKRRDDQGRLDAMFERPARTSREEHDERRTLRPGENRKNATVWGRPKYRQE